MRGLLPPTPSGTPLGDPLAALGLSDRLARPGNVKEHPTHIHRYSYCLDPASLVTLDPADCHPPDCHPPHIVTFDPADREGDYKGYSPVVS
eukprot:5338119-Pyramimonas_sp.AAC.1